MILEIPLEIEGDKYIIEVNLEIDAASFAINNINYGEMGPILQYQAHLQALRYIQDNHANILRDVEDALGERKWESDDDR